MSAYGIERNTGEKVTQAGVNTSPDECCRKRGFLFAYTSTLFDSLRLRGGYGRYNRLQTA